MSRRRPRLRGRRAGKAQAFATHRWNSLAPFHRHRRCCQRSVIEPAELGPLLVVGSPPTSPPTSPPPRPARPLPGRSGRAAPSLVTARLCPSIVHANRASRITAMPDGAKDVGQSGAGSCRSSLQMPGGLGRPRRYLPLPLRDSVANGTTSSHGCIADTHGCPETTRILQGASELRTKRWSSVPRTHACTHAHFARRRRGPRFFRHVRTTCGRRIDERSHGGSPHLYFSLSLSLSLVPSLFNIRIAFYTLTLSLSRSLAPIRSHYPIVRSYFERAIHEESNVELALVRTNRGDRTRRGKRAHRTRRRERDGSDDLEPHPRKNVVSRERRPAERTSRAGRWESRRWRRGARVPTARRREDAVVVCR